MSRVIFIPLMVILKGGVRLLLDPLLLGTLRFYGLSPVQCLPNFYCIVSCVSQLNKLYDLKLTHHDISFLYSCCGSPNNNYYLKVQDNRIRLVSYLPNSNKNSQGGIYKGEWELACQWAHLPDFSSKGRLVTLGLIFSFSAPLFFLKPAIYCTVLLLTINPRLCHYRL